MHTPLPLSQYTDDDAAVTAALLDHFGTDSGTVVLGVTAHSHHSGIHRASLELPRLPHCALTAHGDTQILIQAYALTDRDWVSGVAEVLTELGVQSCRMCRRCWKPDRHLIPSHTYACWHKTATSQH